MCFLCVASAVRIFYFFERCYIIKEFINQLIEVLGEQNVVKKPSQYFARCTVNTIERFDKVIELCVNYYKLKGYEVLFRGQKYANWSIVPSISRSKGFAQYEYDLIKESKFNGDFELKCENLFFAQHYGFPTRLLDVTSDKYVSLWFATEPFSTNTGKQHDGEVIVFPSQIVDSSHAIVGFNLWQIENYERIKTSTINEIIEIYTSESNLKLTSDNLYYRKCIYAINPVELFNKKDIRYNRVFNQEALGVLIPFQYIRGNNNSGSEYYYSLYRKNAISIKISGDCKKEIRQKLDEKGINEKFLFEGDLEHLSNYIVQKYKIKRSNNNEENK